MEITPPAEPRHYHSAALSFLSRGDGLPSGQVHSLTQSANNVFWYATPCGLARYDGSRVSTYTKADGLSSHGLRAIKYSTLGSLWVGSDVGLDLLNADGIVATEGPGIDWDYGLIDCIFFATTGAWVGTARGLYRRLSGRWFRESDPLIGDYPVRVLEESERGQLYAGVGGVGLLRYDTKQWLRVADLDSHCLGEILALCRGPRGSMIVGGMHGFALINDTGRPIGTSHSNEPVTAALFHNDQLWLGIGGQLRVYHLVDNRWQPTQVVAEEVVINRLHADGYGNIWGATESDGVLRVSAFAELIRPINLSSAHSVFSVRECQHEQLLLGGDQLSHHLTVDTDPTVAAEVGISEPLAEPIAELDKQQVWDLVEDSDGRLWAATASGLLRFKTGDSLERVGATHAVLAARVGHCSVAVT